VHGASWHDEPEPLNVTACPVTGAIGEKLNAAVGAGGKLTTPVGLELAAPDPAEFDAVTTARIV
jgi:hypothetical protein